MFEVGDISIQAFRDCGLSEYRSVHGVSLLCSCHYKRILSLTSCYFTLDYVSLWFSVIWNDVVIRLSTWLQQRQDFISPSSQWSYPFPFSFHSGCHYLIWHSIFIRPSTYPHYLYLIDFTSFPFPALVIHPVSSYEFLFSNFPILFEGTNVSL